MKWVKVAIGAVIAIAVVPMIANTVADLTGDGGALDGTVAGTLIDLAHLYLLQVF